MRILGTGDAPCMIEFESGILGFETHTEFVMKAHAPGTPFYVLESAADPSVGFVVVDPWLLTADYIPEIWPDDAVRLGLSAATDGAVGIRLDQLEVWAILTLASDPARMTVNLAGPIVVNPEARRGRQVVQRDQMYKTRHLVVEELQRSRELAGRLQPALRMSG